MAQLVAKLAWVAPTHNVDGSPIDAEITYDIYQITAAMAPVVTGVKETHYAVPLTHIKDPHCFYVRAVVAGKISLGSNIACVNK